MDTPSEFVGLVAQVAIVLVAVVEVLQTLSFTAWAAMVQTFLEYMLLKVVVAVAIVAVGFALGNHVRALIANRATEDDASKGWIGGRPASPSWSSPSPWPSSSSMWPPPSC
ncbi:MAG: hypothetical protein R3F43_15280 [bacterium]